MATVAISRKLQQCACGHWLDIHGPYHGALRLKGCPMCPCNDARDPRGSYMPQLLEDHHFGITHYATTTGEVLCAATMGLPGYRNATVISSTKLPSCKACRVIAWAPVLVRRA